MLPKALLVLSFCLASCLALPTNTTGLNSTSLQQCTSAMDGAFSAGPPSDFHYSGGLRRYYFAAEESPWNSAPSGWNNWKGMPMDASTRANLAGYTASGSMGLSRETAVHRGCIEASFTQRTPQPPTQGIQGPTLRAEVGDMIEILFDNKLLNNYASMHSMGLAYSKQNEGSLYPN
jgi:manganese oxidase